MPREETLPQLEMIITAIAEALDVSRQTPHGILAEKKAATVEMALRLGKFLGASPDLWTNLQVNYDKQRIAREPDLDAIPVYGHVQNGEVARHARHSAVTSPAANRILI